MNYGECIRQARRAKKMSQAKLGAATAVSREVIGRIERGEVEPALSWLRRAAPVLELAAEDLLPPQQPAPSVSQAAVCAEPTPGYAASEPVPSEQLVRLIDLFREAPSALRQEVLNVLEIRTEWGRRLQGRGPPDPQGAAVGTDQRRVGTRGQGR